MADVRLAKVQSSLDVLEKDRTLEAAKQVVRDVSALVVPDLSEDLDSVFRLFNDQEGKLKANASWFFTDSIITDRLATYTLDTPAESNLDIKVFGVKKAKKGTISWAVGLTPNFEDEPFNGKFNVGIDFIIPESLDRVIVALSKNYVIRTLELRGHLTATFQEILNSWISVTDLSRKVEFHEILWSSLDLSPINKKFYEGISQRFISLRQHIETSGALDHEHAAQFANRLIGRVIFTWFLDKKSLIEPTLKYFESEDYKDDTDYYREKLESLFFEVLNTPVSDRSAADTSTPYLNGGLFEPKPGDLYKDKTLTFPKNFFDDFLGFLRAYNFTTDESTTEFQQVAIDPEMLGRIFENLLAEVSDDTGEQARKAKGAFYTPRRIVDFMCREALREYLKSKLEPSESLDQRLYQLIDASERNFQDQDHNWRRDLKPYKEKIFVALDELKILDPACGSGAFPIGMLQLLTKVYERLEPRMDAQKTKISIIEKNIFGVDIEPMAVEISRLRTWLAIVVDEESGSSKVKPLPNLDFKFVCANSLLSLEDLNSLSIVDEEVLSKKLQNIREQFFRTESSKKKNDLRASYQFIVREELTLFEDAGRASQLKSFQPFESDSIADFFDPFQMFGFHEFDIVIANPPYLSEKGHREAFEPVRHSELGKRFYVGKMDLFYFFFHRGIDLLKEGGILCYITTNYFTTAKYANKLRADLLERTSPRIFLNFGGLRVFDSAAGQHNMITLVSRGDSGGDCKTFVARPEVSSRTTDEVLESIFGSSSDYVDVQKVPIRDLFSNNQIRLTNADSHEIELVLDLVASATHTLGLHFNAQAGAQTQSDRVSKSHIQKFSLPSDWLGKGIFVLKREELVELSLDTHEMEIVKPWFKNSDIRRYKLNTENSEVVLFADKKQSNLENRPKIQSHLNKYRMIIDAASSNSPYMHRPRAINFEGPKIVTPYKTPSVRFAMSESAWYGSGDVYYITDRTEMISLWSLLGVLNSELLNAWFWLRGKRKGNLIEMYEEPLSATPLPAPTQVNSEIYSSIGMLAQKQHAFVFSHNGQASPSIDGELNELVYDLFGLSDPHKKICEDWSREWAGKVFDDSTMSQLEV